MKETLILTFSKKTKQPRDQVYRHTLNYIADNLPSGEVYRFVNNQDLLKFLGKHKFSTVIATSEIPLDTAFLLKGAGLVQILIGMRQDLIDISDIIIDPLIRKSENYLVGMRYLLPSLLTQISAKSLAEIIGIDSDTLTEEVNHNEAEVELLDIAQLYQKLQWDSDFFGINIGYISCLRLTPNIEKHIKKFIHSEKIDLLEYLCNCHDRESVITSEKNGYSFVDMRLTFEQFLQDGIKSEQREHYSVGKGKKCDIEKLKQIARDIYKHSRYYFDENFSREKVIEFYVNWVEKAVRGQFDDYAYVLYYQEQPIGFCTIKKMRRCAAKIGLFGMDAKHAGGGLASYLLNMSLYKLKEEEDINYVEVVTQGRNYAAQRLYQRCGFITKSTELWYHKWFH